MATTTPPLKTGNRSHNLNRFTWNLLKIRLKQTKRYLKKAATHPEQDPEYVHQMRVWSRRTGVACQFYRDQLPKSEFEWFLKQMKRVRKAANTARDCDVMKIRFEQMPVSHERNTILQIIDRSRQTAQKLLEEVYHQLLLSGKFHTHYRALKKVLLASPSRKPLSNKQFLSWHIKQLQRPLRRFTQATTADLTVTEKLHQLRIQGKHLRYAFELVSPLLNEKKTSNLDREFKKLQNLLGELNDHQTAATIFEDWAGRTSHTETAELLLALKKQELALLEKTRREFQHKWPAKRLNGIVKQFKRLRA